MTPYRRSGFTLIELLVVMGVILLLTGIAVLSFAKLNKVAGDRATQTRLALCASMLSEYEIAATLTGVESVSGGAGAPVGNPGNVSVSVGVNGSRYGSVVQQTAHVMQVLTQVPASNSMMGQLPGNAMLSATTGTSATPTGWFDPLTGAALPVVLDAWKNPIIFVPAGGLLGVYIGGTVPPSGVSTSTGGPWGHQVVVRSVDNRPFWASAGEDGNFQYGDDNLYSCAVVFSAN